MVIEGLFYLIAEKEFSSTLLLFVLNQSCVPNMSYALVYE